MCIYIQTSHKISNFFSSINIFINYFYLYLFFLLIYGQTYGMCCVCCLRHGLLQVSMSTRSTDTPFLVGGPLV